MSGVARRICSIALGSLLLISGGVLHSLDKDIQAQTESFATLPNGNYQLCSGPEPAPNDWHDGFGVCLVFEKVEQQVTGYYGYPHSDNFICLRGELTNHRVDGEALFLSWAGRRAMTEPELEQDETFVWDLEGRLTLTEGELVYDFENDRRMVWFWFHRAELDLENFYQYSELRMNDPSNLCPWNQEKG